MLQHEIQFGKYEEQIRKVAAQRGDPNPFPDKPVLSSAFYFYWVAFQDLNSVRTAGFSIGPIPWTAVDRYAHRHELSNEEFDLLWAIISHVDNTYLGLLNEKANPKKDEFETRGVNKYHDGKSGKRKRAIRNSH